MNDGRAPVIVQCPKCGAKNRVRSHDVGVTPLCGRCRTPLDQSLPQKNADGLTTATSPKNRRTCAILTVALAAVVCGIVLTPLVLSRDFTQLTATELSLTQQTERTSRSRLSSLKAKLEAEVREIDADRLRTEATLYYQRLLAKRQTFAPEYALTPREKALLRLRQLASDSTRSYHDKIVALAREASPAGSDVALSESSSGLALRISFDMSSMTSGEVGTRTKHFTKESLRKEVVTLISRVTHDLFQFCKGFGLDVISVGCRHRVETDGAGQENMVLLRMRIHSSTDELSSDPFLESYSTERSLVVEEDNFDQVEIQTIKALR